MSLPPIVFVQIGWLKLLADQVDTKMTSRAVTGHVASIGISGAASYVLGDFLAFEFGWRWAFVSAGLTAAIAWINVALAVPSRPSLRERTSDRISA